MSGSRLGARIATLLWLAALAAPAPAQQEPGSSTPEAFEATDPYTKGKREALDKAGYFSFGPFPLAEGIQTADVEEVLGGVRVLWVETAHFKLGSLLHTYRRGTDDHEEKRLSGELRRLAKTVPRIQANARELDPWLRLHLYAQRLEEQYAEFQALAGVTDADFGGKPAADAEESLGPGKYLGSEMKPSVILTEKPTQIDRFARRWIQTGESSWYRARLPGGSWFFGVAADVVREMGTPLDSALHALVASNASYGLSSAFRGTLHSRPLWLQHGLALHQGRKIEPRWCMYVPRDSPGPEDESWRWEQRLAGLVANDFVAGWDEMLEWPTTNKLEARHHMTAWSRVAWLAQTDRAGFQALLRAACARPQAPGKDPASPVYPPENQRKLLQECLGKSPAELDVAWRRWVKKEYPRK
jgi:hypothetical protein